MRSALQSKLPVTSRCLGAVALMGCLVGCTDHITVGWRNPSDLDATATSDGSELSIGCTEITQLKPVVDLGTVVSEVVPGANACEIAVDPAGLVVAACASWIPATVGVDTLAPGQTQELFVQKRTTNGTLIFHTPIAGVVPQAVAAAESGDTFVLGLLYPTTTSDSGFSLTRLTPAGDIAWMNTYYKMYDGANARGALAAAVDGTLWVTGSTNFIAAQFDASGNQLQTWTLKSGGNPGWGAGQAVVILDNGDILVAGVFNQAVDFGGGLLGDDAGSTASGFSARYTASGQYVTSQVFAPSGNVQDVGLASGPGGSTVLTANLNDAAPSVFGCSTPDSTVAGGFVAKLDDSLAVEWARLIPALVGTPAMDAQGNVSIPLKGPNGVYLAKLDPTGTSGTTRSTTSGDGPAYHVALSPAGITYVSGGFVGSVSFGSAPLTCADPAAYLLSITP